MPDLKSFVEQVIFGVVLLLVGTILTYGNNYLSAKNDFRHEVNKIRIIKAGEVWEKFSEIENSFNKLYSEVEKVRVWGQMEEVTEKSVYEQDSVKLLKEKFDREAGEYFDLIRRYEFYLGKPIYRTYVELFRGLYIIETTQKADIWAQNRDKNAKIDIEEAKKHLEAYKLNILHVRELLLDGI